MAVTSTRNVSAVQWSAARDGTEFGPYDQAAMESMAITGEILPTDSVWRDGLSSWVPASQVFAFPPSALQPPHVATPQFSTARRPASPTVGEQVAIGFMRSVGAAPIIFVVLLLSYFTTIEIIKAQMRAAVAETMRQLQSPTADRKNSTP